MVFEASTMCSLSPFSSTVTLSRGTTATTEKAAPSGFQHWVQPQAWLWATSPLMPTLTGLSLHLQTSVPPAKLPEPFLTPWSTAGWIAVMGLSSLCLTFLKSQRCFDLEHDDRTDRLALMHQIESLVDLLELEHVGDHRIDLDLAVHVPVDDLRDVGAAARAAERRALPDPAGDQLERARRDFLAGFRHPDHDRHAPAAMTGFQRLAHHGGVAGAVEGVVGAAVGQRHQVRDDIAVDLLGIDEMGHAETAAPLLLGIVEVDADDLVGAHHPRALDHVEPDAAEAEHHHIGARGHLGGIDHRTDAGGHAAADVAALVERRVFANLRHRDLRQHGEIRECRAAHVMEDRLALVAEARGAVGHQALALGGADRGAEIGLLAQAAFALAAFRGVERDHMIARLHRGDAQPDLADDAGALMAEDRGKDPLAVEAIERVGIGVADAGRLDLEQDFTGLGAFQIDFDDFKRLFCLERDCGA